MLATAIVGGGLCGLALAKALHEEGRPFALFEARPRLGGRIYTVACETARMPIDLGATWFWPQAQPRIAQLAATLGLSAYPQWDGGDVLYLTSPNVAPRAVRVDKLHGDAHRLEGGMGTLVQALAARLPAERVRTDHALTAVTDHGDHVELAFRTANRVRHVKARRVVLCVPPRVLDERVRFTPDLDGRLIDCLRRTPTWMAHQAKVVVGYEQAFWRTAGHSGSAFAAHAQAVLGELFDACDAQARHAALGGFLALLPPQREALQLDLPMFIRSQLVQFFGPEALRGERHYHDWADEPYTCASLDRNPPRTAPHYGHHLLRQAYWNHKLHFGGTETASYGGGYLEGALEAAEHLHRELELDWRQAA